MIARLRLGVMALLLPALLAVSLAGAARMGDALQDELQGTTLALLGVDAGSLCSDPARQPAAGTHCPICFLLRPPVFDRALPAAQKASLQLLARRGPTMPPPGPRPVRDPALGLRGPPRA